MRGRILLKLGAGLNVRIQAVFYSSSYFLLTMLPVNWSHKAVICCGQFTVDGGPGRQPVSAINCRTYGAVQLMIERRVDKYNMVALLRPMLLKILLAVGTYNAEIIGL
jgi:hypothetical protein